MYVHVCMYVSCTVNTVTETKGSVLRELWFIERNGKISHKGPHRKYNIVTFFVQKVSVVIFQN